MSLKKELESLAHFTRNIDNLIIRNRVMHILEWYIRKSTFYKNLYYTFSVILIVLNAIIPLINQIHWQYGSIIVSIISTVATIITSLVTLFSMKDTWFRYRKSAELMKKECMRFNGRCAEYGESNRDEIFIGRFECIIDNERDDWQKNKFDKYDEQK